jgi:hypothetical protein
MPIPKKSVDEFVNFVTGGYKSALDWQELNNTLVNVEERKLVAAKASQDTAEIIAANCTLQRHTGDPSWQKKDHEMELIWCSFREFSVTYLGKVQPKLAVQQPKVVDIIAYLNYNYRSSKVKYTFSKKKGSHKKSSQKNRGQKTVRSVRCKGKGIQSLHKCRQAFEWAFMKAGYNNLFAVDLPLRDVFKQIDDRMGDSGLEKKVSKSFDLWSDIDRLREYCLETRNDLYGLRAWTMILLMLALFLKRADVTHLTVEGIGIPRSKTDGKPILDEDGYPRYLRFWLRKSTGDGSAIPGAIKFGLMRNYRDRKLCAVVSLCDYLNLTGITEGTIFRNFENGSRTKFNSQAMSVDDVSTVCSEIYKRVFGKNHRYTTHSPRLTAAKLAAMCGAEHHEIKRCGRWKSEIFLNYVESGKFDVVDGVVGAAENVAKRWAWFPFR